LDIAQLLLHARRVVLPKWNEKLPYTISGDCFLNALLDALLQGVAKPVCSNSQRVQGDAELVGELLTILNFGPLFFSIVLNYQFAILSRKLLDTFL
jgi:hypothetical protein